MGVYEVHIYNRRGAEAVLQRACPLLVETSLDGVSWSTFFRLDAGQYFGSEAGEPAPLIARVSNPVRARYLRITVPSASTCLHLAEVEVYGF
jgi:hypothetical protein